MKNVYLILGSVGAGKSTITSLIFSLKRFKMIEFVSADIYKKMFFDDHPDLRASYEMARVYMKYKIEKLIATGKSFALEMVPSTQGKIDLLQTLKYKHSYNIVAVYIGTSAPIVNLARVSKRAAEGADIVKEEKTLSRHTLSFSNIKKILDLDVETYFIDNTEIYIKLVAYQKQDKLHIYNSVDWFEEFVLKII